MEEILVPIKRKRVVLTLEQKLEVIKLKDEGKSFYDIASRFNIGISTIKDLLKKRNQIFEAVQKNKAFGFSRKTLREGNRPDVENILYEWVCKKLDQDEVITNNMLLRQATEITRELKQEEWKPSNGWLCKFKHRYSLTAVKEEFVSSSNIIFEENFKEDSEEEISQDLKPETIELFNYAMEPDDPSQMSPLDAADRLLEFVTAHNFPLKEIITLRMIRDRIIEMQDTAENKLE